MGVRVSGLKDADKEIKDYLSLVDKAMKRTMTYIGESCVAHARDRSGEESWYDHTGNLRSSVGYALAKDGEIVSESSFSKVGGQPTDVDGSAEGKAYAETLAKYEIPSGYALVVVAGMDYASDVEALQGKDVLASAELQGEKLANQLLPQILK